jgi:hypothetical protein
MACKNNWTVQIHDVNENEPVEIRPVQLSLTKARKQFDVCRAKFKPEVGEMLKPHTRYGDDAQLNNRKVVDVLLNGRQVQRLMFKPDSVDYGNDFTHITFHDLQKSLDDGLVDLQRETISAREAYQICFEKATNDLINGISYAIPANSGEVLVGESGIFVGAPDEGGSPFAGVDELRGLEGDVRKFVFGATARKIEQEETLQLTNSFFAVDFDRISPLKAILRLNEKFSLQTWVQPDGDLIVGTPEVTSQHHLAAPDDDRVWRYKDPRISHSREPIKTVIVEGAWVDEPDVAGLADDIGWFQGDNGSGVGDVVATGIATRTDVDRGKTIRIGNTKAKRDALPKIAKATMREKMKQQSTGTVELDSELSGEYVSKLRNIEPGDLLQIVPHDELFDNPNPGSGVVGSDPDVKDRCRDFVNNEVYLIDEVEHNVTGGGHWMVQADVGMYSQAPIKSFLRYFDPESQNFLVEEDVFDFQLTEFDI